MNILITSPSLDTKENVSGISSVVRLIMKHGQHNYKHYVFGSEDKDIDKKGFSWFKKMVGTFYSYHRFLSNNEIDIVHLNVPCDTKGVLREYIISGITQWHKRKMLLHLHGGEFLMKKPDSRLLDYLFKKLLSRGQQIVLLNNLQKKNLSEFYNISNTVVIPNGIEIPKEYKYIKNKDTELAQLLYLGRIEKLKGVNEIIEAFGELYAKQRFRFVLCGAGPLKDHMVKEISSFMKDDFRYEGVVSGERKQQVIRESDLFILPSYGEGLPMALLETMSVGVVPLVSDDISLKEVVKDKENGILVRKYDSGDIVLKLEALLGDLPEMERLSESARLTIEREFSLELFIERLESTYTTCLSAK